MPFTPKTTPRPWIKKPKPFERNRQGEFDYSSTAWKKLRAMFRKAHPICAMCERKGIIKEGNVTDHIVPISKGGDPWAWDNLQTLCTEHHNSKSGKEK